MLSARLRITFVRVALTLQLRTIDRDQGDIVRVILLVFALWNLTSCTVSVKGPPLPAGQSEKRFIYDTGHRDILVEVYNVLSHSPNVAGIRAVEGPGLGYASELKNTDMQILIRPVSAFDSWGRGIVGYVIEYHLNGTIITLTPVESAVARVESLVEIQTQIAAALISHQMDVPEFQYIDP
jgi:hypothetical protein